MSLDGGLEPFVGISVGSDMIDSKMKLVNYCRLVRRFEAKVWTWHEGGNQR